jgi:hypothetical protein
MAGKKLPANFQGARLANAENDGQIISPPSSDLARGAPKKTHS